MHRDDISRLYKYLGQPSQNYLDFQTEDDFRERINRVALQRGQSVSEAPASASSRRNKIIAVVSIGNLPGRKLVAGLAWAASRRLQGKVPVHVVDLIPTSHQEEEKAFLLSSGVRHVLIDTSDQAVRMEAVREVAWLERQIVADYDDGLIFVDVPERVMHARHHAMSAADLVLVLLPSAMTSVRAIEDIEAEFGEAQLFGVRDKLRYLLVETKDRENLSSWLRDELMAREELFAPLSLQAEAIPGMRELTAMNKLEAAGPRGLLDVCNFILARIGS